MDIAGYIDHTVLAADATKERIESLCREAVEYGFASVCVNSCWVPLAARLLEGSTSKVCTVVGFPLGASCQGCSGLLAGRRQAQMVVSSGCLLGCRGAARGACIHINNRYRKVF